VDDAGAEGDGDDVEADVAAPVGGEDVVFGGGVDAASLAVRDGLFGFAIFGGGACLYFYKENPVITLDNDVNFTATAAVVSGQYVVAFRFEIPGGHIFAIGTSFDFIAHNYIIPLTSI